MRIPLDRQNTQPLYQQIETYLRQGILSGSLAPDTRLPACRQLARDLGVNRITVENAYSGLEAEGLVFRAWAAAPTSCRPSRSRRSPKAAPRLPGLYGSRISRPGTS